MRSKMVNNVPGCQSLTRSEATSDGPDSQSLILLARRFATRVIRAPTLGLVWRPLMRGDMGTGELPPPKGGKGGEEAVLMWNGDANRGRTAAGSDEADGGVRKAEEAELREGGVLES